MPTFNKESTRIYKENEALMKAVYECAQKNYVYQADTEHNKIIKMAKYATFNEQLTIAQLGWAKAYARRNNITSNNSASQDISSTQSADSSTISAE
jgi:hypothetical protein